MKILFTIVGVMLFSGTAGAGDYTDNHNSTVTDNVTGLMWQQQDDNTTRTWEEAISYCEGLALAGHIDWRLPNIKELASITDYSRPSPTIDPIFTGTFSGSYWSSTSFSPISSRAWFVDFLDGDVDMEEWDGHAGGGLKASKYDYVRCVRGGQ